MFYITNKSEARKDEPIRKQDTKRYNQIQPFNNRLFCSSTNFCPPVFLNSLKSLMNRLTVSAMTRHNQSTPPSFSVKKIQYGRKVSWNVKWYEIYGRNLSWIVIRYREYGRKVSWIVKRYGNYGRKVSWIVIRYGQYGRK